jgi:hypothetical protein
MKKYQYRVIGIFISLTLILLQYQNCASSKGSSLDATDEAAIVDGSDDRHVINEVNTGGIQFLQSKTILTASDQNLSAYGSCAVEQQDGKLSWQLLDDQGNLLFKGSALCDKGIFEVRFEGVDDLACDANLTLKAYFGAQAKTETLINKKCN